MDDWRHNPRAPLAPWERAILDSNTHREGEGEVTFTRTDGLKVVKDNVRIDSIGPSATNKGVITFENFDNEFNMTHLPFVESWTVEYR